MRTGSDQPAELHFELRVPPGAGEGSPLLVLLHGRGSHEADLLGLAPFLPDDAILATPRGLYPAPPWGYGRGWAWYRYEAEDRVVEETLEATLRSLDALLERLDRELPVRPGVRVLGGFSQGGTTSLAWALTRPGRAHGVVNFSGFLVDSPRIDPAAYGEPKLPVFWGHGREDPNIPFSLAEKGRGRLEGAGHPVEAFDHPGGHTLTEEEVSRFRRWLEALPAGRR